MFSRIVVLTLLVVCLLSCVVSHPDRSMMRLLADRERPAALNDMYRFYSGYPGYSTPQKRNNAEVVNHILKNFGTLDRLGDVGK